MVDRTELTGRVITTHRLLYKLVMSHNEEEDNDVRNTIALRHKPSICGGNDVSFLSLNLFPVIAGTNIGLICYFICLSGMQMC